MSWWSKALWELRDKMRCAYKCKTLANSPTNQAAYSALKAEYQKMIRFSKAENFKSMCSTTEDLFGLLRELTSRGSYPFPTAICSSGFTHTDTVAILKEFGKAFFPPSIPSTVMQCELENNCNAFMSKTHWMFRPCICGTTWECHVGVETRSVSRPGWLPCGLITFKPSSYTTLPSVPFQCLHCYWLLSWNLAFSQSYNFEKRTQAFIWCNK